MKRCSTCKKLLGLSLFYRNKSRADGLQNVCKKCSKKYFNSDAHKKWILSNPEKMILYRKKWYENNIEYYRNRHKGYSSQKRFSCNVSRLISAYMNKNGKRNKRGRHWESLVGYTIEELCLHLELLFVDGMTWDNYGKWHIDHIIPQSYFKFNSPDDVEFKMCWRLENLQPLWARDNIGKSNKLRLTR